MLALGDLQCEHICNTGPLYPEIEPVMDFNYEPWRCCLVAAFETQCLWHYILLILHNAILSIVCCPLAAIVETNSQADIKYHLTFPKYEDILPLPTKTIHFYIWCQRLPSHVKRNNKLYKTISPISSLSASFLFTI